MEVYLDNSATTRQYDEVTDAMAEAMRETYGNPSSLHSLGVVAEKKVREARKSLAAAFGYNVYRWIQCLQVYTLT